MTLSPTPLTPTQIPEKSILDVFARQTYLGNTYGIAPIGFALTGTVETPIILLTNPTGSGVSLFSFNRRVTATATTTLVKFYANPTVTNVGTPTSATNARSGSKNVSKSVISLSPTLSSFGNFSSMLPATTVVSETNVVSILDPGGTILITATQVAAPASTLYIELFWYEI